LNDGQFGNSRSWISNEAGRGWAQTELSKVSKIDRIVWGRDREEKFTDRLATKYHIDVSLDGKQWTPVAGSWDRGADFQISPESKTLIAERDDLVSQLRIVLAQRVDRAAKSAEDELAFLEDGRLERVELLLKRFPHGSKLPDSAGANQSGKTIRISSPPPRRLAASTRPPALVTMCFTIARPSPVPRDALARSAR